MFDVDKYRNLLATQWLGQSVNFFDELDSTNCYLKNLPPNEITHGQLCLTDHQTRGRGQYERNWESEAGKNLTFTLSFCPAKANRFHILTLACALAAVQQIEASASCRAFIKWPNDIIVGDKKIGGILTETVFNGNVLDRLLVGIGLNINTDHFSEELDEKAGSLKQFLEENADRELFLSQLLSRIEFEYLRWHKQNDALLKCINQKIIGYGKWLRLNVNGRQLADRYKLIGINQKGELAVIDKNGGLKTFSYEQIRLITD